MTLHVGPPRWTEHGVRFRLSWTTDEDWDILREWFEANAVTPNWLPFPDDDAGETRVRLPVPMTIHDPVKAALFAMFFCGTSDASETA